MFWVSPGSHDPTGKTTWIIWFDRETHLDYMIWAVNFSQGLTGQGSLDSLWILYAWSKKRNGECLHPSGWPSTKWVIVQESHYAIGTLEISSRACLSLKIQGGGDTRLRSGKYFEDLCSRFIKYCRSISHRRVDVVRIESYSNMFDISWTLSIGRGLPWRYRWSFKAPQRAVQHESAC